MPREQREILTSRPHMSQQRAPAARELVPKHDAFAAAMPELSSVEDSAAAALGAGPTVPPCGETTRRLAPLRKTELRRWLLRLERGRHKGCGLGSNSERRL